MVAGVARVLQLLTLLKQHCREAERWRARWRARTAANFKLRLAVLLGVSLLNVAVGAVLYKWTASGEESWKSAFFTVYAVSEQTRVVATQRSNDSPKQQK